MHAAGNNDTSDVDRFANLVQVGSAYGRTMELLDKARMSLAVYPVLQQLQGESPGNGTAWNERFTRYVIEATAEGYAFPANMELEPPINGLAPMSQQDILSQCLADGESLDVLSDKVSSQCKVKRSH